MNKIEQHVNLKFLVKLKRKSPSECIELLKDLYGDNLMSRSRVSERHKRFSEGRQELEDVSHPGHPSTSKTNQNIPKISEIVR